MGPFFIWKGINSLDMGIMVKKLPPYERPEARIQKKVVPGRNGFLTEDDGTFSEILKPCECVLDEGNVHELGAWLTGTSDLILSNDPDVKYRATIINKISLIKIIPTLHEFIVQFDCQPYPQEVAQDVITITGASTLINPRTAPSKPIIKVNGTGSIVLTIGTWNIYLYNVSGYVVIDSVLMDAYKDTVLKNNDMTGDFPILQPGENPISWTGTVTSVEITPNWSWL